jgi:3-deoxy-D-manno-octulosonic-acid transferase
MLPPGLTLYRAASHGLGLIAPPWLDARAAKGKEDPARLGERLGRASAPRPAGPLVWMHGASVGESLMLLALLQALRRMRSELHFLVTTGTVTSAALMAGRLPESAIHQYAPLDAPAGVRAFLDHWRPDLGVFAESELWPNLLIEAKIRGVRLALVNARMTERSLARWRASPASARRLLSVFDWIGAADRATSEGLTALAGRPAPFCGNLKQAGDPLPADSVELAALQEQFRTRLVWLAASTHAGEDEIALEAHKLILAERPDALLIIAPRHPPRGEAVTALAREGGFAARRRSIGETLDAGTQVYVADTLGELGLWYRLAAAALVCGSLVEGPGGHNPLEPAILGAPILTGPLTHNFGAIFDELVAAGGAARVCSADEIAQQVRVSVGSLRETRVEAARAVATGGDAVLETVLGALRPLLPSEG